MEVNDEQLQWADFVCVEDIQSRILVQELSKWACHMSDQRQGLTWHAASLVRQNKG